MGVERAVSCKKTLGSRRSLVPSRAETVVACANILSLRGWKLSTAASDTERERVFLQLTARSTPGITENRVSPPV